MKRMSHHTTQWKLFIDGASRNNPGPSGAGIYIEKNGEPFLKKGFFLGKKTNNQAEYLALLLGLFFMQEEVQPNHTLHIISDSQLLVRQLLGAYAVKNPELKLLFQCAFRLLGQTHYTIQHVLREDNAIADALANEGIDKKIAVPTRFLEICPL